MVGCRALPPPPNELRDSQQVVAKTQILGVGNIVLRAVVMLPYRAPEMTGVPKADWKGSPTCGRVESPRRGRVRLGIATF